MTASGRPTRFEPEMCAQARNYCLLGATSWPTSSMYRPAPSIDGSPSAPISVTS
jgi:hypothetical protein